MISTMTSNHFPHFPTISHDFPWWRSPRNYIQETGRCARDGQSGKCVALVSPKVGGAVAEVLASQLLFFTMGLSIINHHKPTNHH